MIDVKRFNRVRQKGLAKISKTLDGEFELRFKRFDPENGDELMQPEIQHIVLEEVLKKRDEYQAEIDGINLILTEIGAI
jgi:hypothetical protein